MGPALCLSVKGLLKTSVGLVHLSPMLNEEPYLEEIKRMEWEGGIIYEPPTPAKPTEDLLIFQVVIQWFKGLIK